MNTKNKKSTALWAQQLFKQSGALITALQKKVYFAQRYHDDCPVREQTPFSRLFSEADKEPLSSQLDAGYLQRLFKDELPVIKNSPDPIEPAHTHAANLTTYCTVLNCYDETAETKTFRLGTQYGRKLDYLPGQYITLSVLIAGQEYKRSYSLASTPTSPSTLEITVKRSPNGGVVSNWLHDNLKMGDTLKVKGPFGKFSCVNHAPQKILFLAAGSGIVPIMSMLRWLADTEARVDVMLLLSFRTPEDIIYGHELKLIAAYHKNIHLTITLTADATALTQWSGLNGRIDKKMLAQQVADLPERTVYLCGPELFMAECKNNLQELSLPVEQLFCESFSVNSPVTKTPYYRVAAQPLRKKTGNYRVKFAKSGKTIATDGQMTLLELAEKSEIIISHECRAGVCGECMIKCRKGQIEMTPQAEIDDFDRKKGWVYACCAYPVSNVVLDI